ncbi:hypothetical protein [Candidatus Methylacidithermus pantelleriae]|uniref:Uncharacterized protein n=1 Tax=Candidatus Methylacidithermus pantelleriae TaxID=2744239 RepID=A0A8J2BQL4_9BACT|nr:hypothetical protein [Candidatus Methylacidithermus pantelleriae]CAF0703892.1 hypothetical protein MPNT_60130 [Candidatus Methylacidithermus pantelleriae]
MIVKGVGPGRNGHRRGLVGWVCDSKVGVILVEERDRLMRFGLEYREVPLAGYS